MSMELSEYYTIDQVAAFFGASRAFIVDAISKGIIKFELFGRKKVVIHKSQIELMKAHRKPNRLKIERPPLKLGEYYDITQAAKAFGITPSTLYKAIGPGIIKADYFDKKKIVIHKSQIEQLKAYRKAHKTDAKRKAQRELRSAGFKYHRNPPPGAPRGSSRNPSPFRRGWSKDGVYYGLTAIEALRERQRSKT